MPHYAFWSWAMPYIGPLDEALTKIYSIELVRPFLEKINKTVWRGTQYFNPVFNAELRPNLLRVSKDKPWSDIQAFKQGDRSEENNNIIPIEDFCKYKYVVYTEVRWVFRYLCSGSHSTLGQNILRPSCLPSSLCFRRAYTPIPVHPAFNAFGPSLLRIYIDQVYGWQITRPCSESSRLKPFVPNVLSARNSKHGIRQ